MSILIPIILAITNIFGSFSVTHSTTVRPTIYVQESVSGNADRALRQALRFDARYTKSRLIVHKCDTSHYCIQIRYGTPSTKAPKGYTVQAETGRGARSALITINRKVNQSYALKVRMYEHELGHAFGLSHNPRCTSIMYYALRCNAGHGRISPERFTAGERKILRNA